MQNKPQFALLALLALVLSLTLSGSCNAQQQGENIFLSLARCKLRAILNWFPQLADEVRNGQLGPNNSNNRGGQDNRQNQSRNPLDSLNPFGNNNQGQNPLNQFNPFRQQSNNGQQQPGQQNGQGQGAQDRSNPQGNLQNLFGNQQQQQQQPSQQQQQAPNQSITDNQQQPSASLPVAPTNK